MSEKDRTQFSIGTILDDTHKRDAVHIAVEPMVAACVLAPGDRVDFASPTDRVKATKVTSGGIGIVDPFLPGYVLIGQRFYVWITPNTVTGMRHEWEHPAFSGSASVDAKEVARVWIGDLAAKIGHPFDYFDSLMEHVRNCIDGGDHFTEHGHEHMRYVWHENEEQFWKHYETLTGVKKPDKYMPVFCCSC